MTILVYSIGTDITNYHSLVKIIRAVLTGLPVWFNFVPTIESD